MTAAIEVLVIRKLDGKSTVKAFVDLRLGGVTMKGCKIVQQDGQKAWLANAIGQDRAGLAERGRAHQAATRAGDRGRPGRLGDAPARRAAGARCTRRGVVTTRRCTARDDANSARRRRVPVLTDRPNIAWALEYASIGWRVHPCRPGEKLPILEKWQERATTDVTLIERWWGRTPDANIAVATGPGSGVFVLDVDGPEGERALVDLERRHGPLPEWYPMQWTGSGRGWQAFFAWPEGREIRNSANRLRPKIDVRGDGGFVVLPPSRHPSGNLYAWATDREPFGIPPEPAPNWLLDLLDPPAQPQAPRQAWNGPGRPTDDRYLLRAIEAELALVASAPQGRRNEQLNESAFNLFRFAQEGRLDAGAIAHGLEAAALHAGLKDKEIEATLKSAAAKRGVRLP